MTGAGVFHRGRDGWMERDRESKNRKRERDRVVGGKYWSELFIAGL